MDLAFFTLVCFGGSVVCLKRPKINEKEAGVGPFLKVRKGGLVASGTSVQRHDSSTTLSCLSA